MDKKITLFLLGLFFLANFFSWSFLFSLRKGELRVVFFDVGQGDAIFIKTPQNHHILIDGGPGDYLLEGLGRQMPFFYNSIDLVILTHPHDDHVAGLIEALKRYDVKEVMCTGVYGEAPVARKWKEMIEEKGYRVARAGKRVSANDFHIDILYPIEDIKNKEVNDLNEVSVVSRFVFQEEYSFLFTGDAYKEQEREILSIKEDCKKEYSLGCDLFSLNSDVLKVGHHGSRTSTAKEFLSAVSPGVAVIMTGKENRYGHPHREVIEKLNEFEVQTKRTDRDGDIIFQLF